MKLIIDIDEEVYIDIMIHNREMRESGKSAYYFEGLIQHSTPIPDNASNRDVIMAMTNFIGVQDEEDTIKISTSWWNSPYQKGGKE